MNLYDLTRKRFHECRAACGQRRRRPENGPEANTTNSGTASYFVIVVPCGDTQRDMDAVLREHTQRNKPSSESRTVARSDPLDAEKLPLWRWFTFEKPALF